jgi:hypothetical protein
MNIDKRAGLSMPFLWEQILKFKKHRIPIASLLVILGLLGLILPVLPGWLLIILGIALLRPGMMANLRERLKSWRV